jgi:hypothetical protein
MAAATGLLLAAAASGRLDASPAGPWALGTRAGWPGEGRSAAPALDTGEDTRRLGAVSLRLTDLAKHRILECQCVNVISEF